MLDVAIVGAGPYGLSCAASLQAAGIVHAIFGHPMQTWREAMPAGMHLKSEGFASNLTDPGRRFTLGAYSARHGLAYADIGLPVPLETFVSYALDFQSATVPHLDLRLVSSVCRAGDGFILHLEDGSAVAARPVVMAVGISYFRHMPAELAGLPRDLVSHSSDHHDLSKFRGRSVTVVGAGASALDTAMLLHEAGARVELVARRAVIDFHHKGALERPLWQRLRVPRTEIGQGWRSVFYTRAPELFRRLPEPVRLRRVARELGPAPGWFVRDRVVNRFRFHLGCTVAGAAARGDQIALTIVRSDGQRMELIQDHVIAGTGYRPDLDRIAPLSPELRAGMRRTGLAPLLSSQGESSVPGLYFVGPVAANSLGPVMRFACGNAWVAPASHGTWPDRARPFGVKFRRQGRPGSRRRPNIRDYDRHISAPDGADRIVLPLGVHGGAGKGIDRNRVCRGLSRAGRSPDRYAGLYWPAYRVQPPPPNAFAERSDVDASA